MSNELMNQLMNVNVTRKKDPDQNYGGWSYALNNLMRNPNLFVGNRSNNDMTDGGFAGTGNTNAFNPLLNIAQVGLPFAADVIFGNKYRTTDGD